MNVYPELFLRAFVSFLINIIKLRPIPNAKYGNTLFCLTPPLSYLRGHFSEIIAMPCAHKFQRDLDLTRLDFEPDTLIVGTFNPAWPLGNDAEWFYGRKTNNFFWDVLPRLYGEPSLINAPASEWKAFCRDKKIAFTDLIWAIDDAEPDNREHIKMLTTYADKTIEYRFEDLEFVDIVKILQRRATIKHVYITRGVTDAFWRHLWNPVMKYCNVHQLHERKLLTPSDEAAYQHEVYNNEHPNDKVLLLEDYILMRWKQEWHF